MPIKIEFTISGEEEQRLRELERKLGVTAEQVVRAAFLDFLERTAMREAARRVILKQDSTFRRLAEDDQ